jgi:hypothetical protein
MAREKCTHGKGTDHRCKAWPIRGGVVCIAHGGAAPQVRAKAAVRDEVMHWGLGDAHTDPGETLLRLVSQSAARVQALSAELHGMVDGDDSGSLRKALVADIWIPSETGEKYKAGEYVRALAKLEAEERDRCATFCAKAIAAGLAERQVRLAERQGALIAELLRSVMDDPQLGLTEQQRRAMPDVARRHLRLAS